MSGKPQSKNRPRLGRGLSSLISISEPAPEASIPSPSPDSLASLPAASTPAVSLPGSLEIPIAQITPNPHQPRRTFDPAALADLAASIRSTGVIQPVVVRPNGRGYQLIAGERRLRAAELAGLAEIPAIIRDVDAVTQAQMALIENIQRQDLNPVDRAQGYRTLIDQLGLTQAELATRLGEDRSSIANFLRLLDLAEPVRAMLRDGRLTVGHAKLIASTPDVLEQQRLAELVLAQDLSVRNLERLLQQGDCPPTSRAPAAQSPHILDLEQCLARQLGMRVQVRARKNGRGKLIIQYASLDQFDELLARMGVEVETA